MKFSIVGLFKAAFAGLVVASVALVTPPPPLVKMIWEGRKSPLSEDGKKKREKKLVDLEKKLIKEDPEVAKIKDDKEKLRRKALKEKRKPKVVKEKEVIIKETLSLPIMEQHQNSTTPFGFTIQQALVRRPGKINGNVMDLIAGDVYCYKALSGIYDPVYIRRPLRQEKYPFSFDHNKLDMPYDLEPEVIKSIQFVVSRSIKEHRFLPVCKLDEKVELERALLRSFKFLPEQYKGCYFSLKKRIFGGLIGLFESRVYGDTTRLHRFLSSKLWIKHLLVHQGKKKKRTMATSLCNLSPEDLSSMPQSDLYIGAGVNRDWPDARGIYLNEARTICMTVNRDCHLRIQHKFEGADMIQAFKDLSSVYRGIQRGLQQQNLHFAYDDKHGFVNWNTNSFGSGVEISAKTKLPYLQTHDLFKVILSQNALKCKLLNDEDGCVEVFSPACYGESEIDNAYHFNYALRRLTKLEIRMEFGVLCDLDLPSNYSVSQFNKYGKDPMID